jgi:hypothetical protein
VRFFNQGERQRLKQAPSAHGGRVAVVEADDPCLVQIELQWRDALVHAEERCGD